MHNRHFDAELLERLLAATGLQARGTAIRWEHPDWHPTPAQRAAADQAEAAALAALRAIRSGTPEVRGDSRDLRPATGELDPHSEGVNPSGVIDDRRGNLHGSYAMDLLHTDGPNGRTGKWSPGSGAQP